ncbi:unnamed protein product [Oreochromis niloticus]|nr:unnamed protein product [Mustela putorius furo]
MLSLLLFLLPPFFLFTPTWALEFRYHNNHEIEQYLKQVSTSNPDITHLYSIGQSSKGQQLWVLALGVSPHQHTVGIPEFKYVGNMHGNEVLGRVLLLQLIDELVRSYRSNETWSLRLLNSTRIHILPTMNPDGFDVADKDCYNGQGRYNGNGIDLNRDFPDAFAGVQSQQVFEERREAEVQAVIGWLRTESFVLSANLHGGAVVASYPYDNSNGGGMQDYNYVWGQCLEITLELSCCKYPPARELPALWNDNKKALLAYIQQVHLGVKGQVFDGSGVPVENAVVEVRGRRNICPFRTNQHGEYYRLLLPGNYTFTVTYPGHEVLTKTLSVPYGPDQYSALKHDFLLRRIARTTRRTVGSATQTDATPTCNYTLQQKAGGPMNRPTWSSLAIGLSMAAVLRSLID